MIACSFVLEMSDSSLVAVEFLWDLMDDVIMMSLLQMSEDSIADFDPIDLYVAIADFEASEHGNISLRAGDHVQVHTLTPLTTLTRSLTSHTHPLR